MKTSRSVYPLLKLQPLQKATKREKIKRTVTLRVFSHRDVAEVVAILHSHIGGTDEEAVQAYRVEDFLAQQLAEVAAACETRFRYVCPEPVLANDRGV